jgi:hypothetical protein
LGVRDSTWRFGIAAIAMAGIAWAVASSLSVWVAVPAAMVAYGCFLLIGAKLSQLLARVRYGV